MDLPWKALHCNLEKHHKSKVLRPPIIRIWGQHTLSEFSVDHPKSRTDPCVFGCSVLELGQTKLVVLPLRDASQWTSSTAAQPGAGGPSGSRWLSKKQSLEGGGKSLKADTMLPIRLKTHQRTLRADKGQGTNGPITSWLLFWWWAHSGQEPTRPWSLSYPYEITTKTHWNPAEPNTLTKGVERWRKHRSRYTNDEGPVRQRTNSTGEKVLRTYEKKKNQCQSQGEVMAGWRGMREVNLSIFGS